MKMDGNFAGGFVGRKGEDYGRAAMRCYAGLGRRRALFTSYELTRVSPFLPPFPFPFFRAALPPLLNAIN
jgi:hypothetical protein